MSYWRRSTLITCGPQHRSKGGDGRVGPVLLAAEEAAAAESILWNVEGLTPALGNRWLSCCYQRLPSHFEIRGQMQ